MYGKVSSAQGDEQRPLRDKNKHITVQRSPDVQKTTVIFKTATGEKPRLWAFFVYIEHFLTSFYLIISHLLCFVTRAKKSPAKRRAFKYVALGIICNIL